MIVMPLEEFTNEKRRMSESERDSEERRQAKQKMITLDTK